MTRYLQKALAMFTRATYTSAHRSFIHFAIMYHCLAPDGSLLPASEDTLMLFTTFLASTLKSQSTKVYLSGVRNLHLEHEFPDPVRCSPTTPPAPQYQATQRCFLRLSTPNHPIPSQEIPLPTPPSPLRPHYALGYHPSSILWLPLEQRAPGTATQGYT